MEISYLHVAQAVLVRGLLARIIEEPAVDMADALLL